MYSIYVLNKFNSKSLIYFDIITVINENILLLRHVDFQFKN